MTNKQKKIFEKACNTFSNIEDAEDLRKNGLHLSSYHTIPVLLNDIYNNGYCVTFIDEIKWFEKQGFRTEKYQVVNYKISLA